MTFDDYCKKTGHYAEQHDRALWAAAVAATSASCITACEEIALKHQRQDGPYAAGKKAGAFECAETIKTAIKTAG